MRSFFKVQVASVLGSLADYLVTILLVEGFNCWYLLANLAGNIIGGTTQFMLCRKWVFQASKSTIQNQVSRFIIYFVGNLILSAATVYFFTNYVRMNYLWSKTVSSILLGLSYNYFMQKKFVFS